MNTKGGPIANAAVRVRGDSDDAHFGIKSKDGIANSRTFIRIIHRNKKKIRVRLFYATDKIYIICHFADDRDVGLIGKSLDDDLAHQLWAVGHQDSNLTSHGSLLLGSRIVLPDNQKR